MKRHLLQALLVSLFLCSCVSPFSEPTDDPYDYLSIKTHPCLQSIQFGRTTWSQVERMLSSCPDIDPDTYGHILPIGDDTKPLYPHDFHWLEQSAPTDVRDSNQRHQATVIQEFVREVNLKVYVDYTIENVLDQYGPPDWIGAYVDQHFVIHLYYPEQGLAAQIAAPLSKAGQLKPDLQIDRLSYSRPDELEFFLMQVGLADEWYSDLPEEVLQPWPGYGQVEVVEYPRRHGSSPEYCSSPAEVSEGLESLEQFLTDCVEGRTYDVFTLTHPSDGVTLTAQFAPGHLDHGHPMNAHQAVYLLEVMHKSLPQVQVYRLEFHIKLWRDWPHYSLGLGDVVEWNRLSKELRWGEGPREDWSVSQVDEECIEQLWDSYYFWDKLPCEDQSD